jgi:hypothetical protein
MPYFLWRRRQELQTLCCDVIFSNTSFPAKNPVEIQRKIVSVAVFILQHLSFFHSFLYPLHVVT